MLQHVSKPKTLPVIIIRGQKPTTVDCKCIPKGFLKIEAYSPVSSDHESPSYTYQGLPFGRVDPLSHQLQVVIVIEPTTRWPAVSRDNAVPSSVTPKTPGCEVVSATSIAVVAPVMVWPATVIIKGSTDWGKKLC